MATLAIKYAFYDTPVDFSKYIFTSLQDRGLSGQSKTLVERTDFISRTIGFAEVFGYTHPGLKKVVESFKSVKLAFKVANFLTLQDNLPNQITFAKVCDFAKDLFESSVSTLRILDKFNISNKDFMIKTGASLGDLCGIAPLSVALEENATKISNEFPKPNAKERSLRILSGTWGVLQNITYIAICALSTMTGLLSLAVAVPAIPLFVFPTLLMAASLFGLFNSYVKDCIKKLPISSAPISQIIAPENIDVVESDVTNLNIPAVDANNDAIAV